MLSKDHCVRRCRPNCILHIPTSDVTSIDIRDCKGRFEDYDRHQKPKQTLLTGNVTIAWAITSRHNGVGGELGHAVAQDELFL